MRLTLEELAVAGAASKEESRRILNGLYVTPDTVVATDSYMVVAMQRLGLPEGEPEQTFETIVPLDMVKAMLPTARKAKVVDLELGADGVIGATAKTAKDVGISWQMPEVDGQYPKWRRVHPLHKGHEKLAEVWLNPALLRDCMATLVQMGAERVCIEIFANKGEEHPPIVITESRGDNLPMIAMLMPMQAGEAAVPEWLAEIVGTPPAEKEQAE